MMVISPLGLVRNPNFAVPRKVEVASLGIVWLQLPFSTTRGEPTKPEVRISRARFKVGIEDPSESAVNRISTSRNAPETLDCGKVVKIWRRALSLVAPAGI